MPDNPYPLIERVAVKAGKAPYVRFDLNDYSIPHTKVQRLLTVLADPNEVRIVDGALVLACHRRSYGKGAQIEDATHVQALVEHKRAARRHRDTDQLAKVAPESQTLLLRAAERVCDNYKTHKTKEVQAWLAKHPRFKLHFTPTSSSWINLVERLFAEITRQQIRRGVFKSVAELEAAIETWLTERNAKPKPFKWTAKANIILEKNARAKRALEEDLAAGTK